MRYTPTMRGAVVLLAAFALGHCLIFSPTEEDKIDEFVQAILSCRVSPAVSVAVVKADETWTKAYGKADVERDRNSTDDTLFCIGSITKSFTSTILAMLIEHNPSVSWDTKLKDILGSEYRFMDDTRTEMTRIKDILSHNTGLASTDIAMISGVWESRSREEVSKRMNFLHQDFPFRYRFHYNNYMYALAGHVAEKLSNGESWENLLNTNILQPLGMASSELLNRTTLENGRYALPYGVKDGKLIRQHKDIFEIHPAEPAGAICSTNVDMAKWMKFHLKGGKLDNGSQIVAKHVLDSTHEPHVVVPAAMAGIPVRKPVFPVENSFSSYGLGWFTGSYNGYKTVFHGGGLHGYTSLMTLFPELNMGIYVALNGVGDSHSSAIRPLLEYYISDILLGDTPWLNTTTACTYPEPWLTMPAPATPHYSWPTAPQKRPLSDYVGKYGNGILGNLAVEDNGKVDVLFFTMSRLQGNMTRDDKHTDVFYVELTGMLWFLSYPNGVLRTMPILFKEGGSYEIDHLIIYFGEQNIFRRNVTYEHPVKEPDTTSGTIVTMATIMPIMAILCYGIICESC